MLFGSKRVGSLQGLLFYPTPQNGTTNSPRAFHEAEEMISGGVISSLSYFYCSLSLARKSLPFGDSPRVVEILSQDFAHFKAVVFSVVFPKEHLFILLRVAVMVVLVVVVLAQFEAPIDCLEFETDKAPFSYLCMSSGRRESDRILDHHP